MSESTASSPAIFTPVSQRKDLKLDFSSFSLLVSCQLSCCQVAWKLLMEASSPHPTWVPNRHPSPPAHTPVSGLNPLYPILLPSNAHYILVFSQNPLVVSLSSSDKTKPSRQTMQVWPIQPPLPPSTLPSVSCCSGNRLP